MIGETMPDQIAVVHDQPYAPLVERILREASVIGTQIIKVDHFLNHRIEPAFMDELGTAMAERMCGYQPDLVLTAEASGIAPAMAAAAALGVPMLYAKKYAPVLVESPELSRLVPSPTKGGDVRLVVSARYLVPGLRVVIVDDFLANGRTALALAEIVAEAGSQVVAAGFVVEKRFQHGRDALVALGIPVVALASVAQLVDGRPIMVQ